MTHLTKKILALLPALALLLSPLSALAYSQGYYEGYYQPYYQGYYQPYYQGYYQGQYQSNYNQASSSIIFLTSGTSFTVPADWNNTNTIEVIGAGGGGQSGAGSVGGIGGGGGGYSRINNLTLTPGSVVTYQIGVGGAGGIDGVAKAGADGTDTFFNGSICLSSSVCARGGRGGSDAGVGAPGVEGVGTIKYYGGFSRLPVDSKGTGGGGAAGINGAGFGPTIYSVSVGGAAGGGSGGAGGATSTAGSAGSEWDATHGSGGGGGGGIGRNTSTATGGAGGLYGGGGGGGAGGAYPGGAGGQGLIIINYKRNLNVTVNAQIKGNLLVTGNLSKGAGTFVIDHPLYPRTKLLYHSFVESPDAKNLYDGIATLDSKGEVTIALPAYFMALNQDFRYQFFPIDAAMPSLYIKSEIKDNHFTIAGGKSGGKISWQVTGNRHDPYILLHPIIPEVRKNASTPVSKGQCLFEPLCN